MSLGGSFSPSWVSREADTKDHGGLRGRAGAGEGGRKAKGMGVVSRTLETLDQLQSHESCWSYGPWTPYNKILSEPCCSIASLLNIFNRHLGCGIGDRNGVNRLVGWLIKVITLSDDYINIVLFTQHYTINKPRLRQNTLRTVLHDASSIITPEGFLI